MKAEFTGNIVSVRAVEDAIRATRKYTEELAWRKPEHPIQGEDFASRVFCKYYEVYPNTELDWDMPMGEAIRWLAGGVDIVSVTLWYNYNTNKAKLIVVDGDRAVEKLERGIPGFKEAVAEMGGVVKVTEAVDGGREVKTGVKIGARVGVVRG